LPFDEYASSMTELHGEQVVLPGDRNRCARVARHPRDAGGRPLVEPPGRRLGTDAVRTLARHLIENAGITA
jgi:hypothetical protein